MGIEADFTMQDLDKMFQGKIQQLVDTVIQTFQFVGERFVTNVRTKIEADDGYRELMRKIPRRDGGKKIISSYTPRYSDDTGNLTSSVGFMILDQGKQVHSQFDGADADGVAAGKAAAEEAASMFPSGTVLIVVAGMQYAAAVESLGYDVLTGSSFIAERELKEALEAITKN